MRLLLAEDDAASAEMLARRLGRRGFEVEIAADGRAALEAARSRPFDLLLLDLDLPEVDGWTVARTLRAEEATRRLPILALTAHSMQGDREGALAAGCDDYHPKPVDLARLLDQVAALVPGGADPG